MAAGWCLRGGGEAVTRTKKFRQREGGIHKKLNREGPGRAGRKPGSAKETGKRGRGEDSSTSGESEDPGAAKRALAASHPQKGGSAAKGDYGSQNTVPSVEEGHAWWALKNLVREEHAVGRSAAKDAISLGWAKAIAAGVSSRTLTAAAGEDVSALQESLSKLVPERMECADLAGRSWMLRISDIQRMWENAIPHLSGVLGGGANKEGFQAMWSYLHGMLARGRLDANLGRPSRNDIPVWDFVSVPASDRARVFILCRYDKFSPARVAGILTEQQSPEELSQNVAALWGESVRDQPQHSVADWHTLLFEAQTFSWALWSGLSYPIDRPVKQGAAAKGASARDRHMSSMQSRKAAGGAKGGQQGDKNKNTEGAVEAARVLDEALAACDKDAVDANFGSLPPKDKQIVIDGANVAWYFTDSSFFCTQGLVKCVAWFIQHGYSRIIAFVPEPYSRDPLRLSERVNVADDIPALEELQRRGIVHLTPSRSDDDAFIIQYAYDNDGYIVSNDNYREFHKEAPEWKKQWLKTRKVFYTFVAGQFIPTAPKILRKPDPNAPSPAVFEGARSPVQGTADPPAGEAPAAAGGFGTAEEESARRLMLYDEEGTGEQLDWGMVPPAPVQGGLEHQFGMAAAWQGQGHVALLGWQQEVVGEQRECRAMLQQVLETLERQSVAIAELQQLVKGREAVS